MAKKMTKPKAKFKKVLKEYKEGKLHSGSKKGPKVHNPKQAVAIAYSEERRKAKHDEEHPKSHSKGKMHHSKHHSLLKEVMHDYMQGAKKLHAYMSEHAEHEEMRDDKMMKHGKKYHEKKKQLKGAETDTSSSVNRKPKRPAESDLNNMMNKPKDEPFYDYAKGDAVKAYFEDGLNAKTGKDNDKESLQFSRRAGVKARK